MVGGVTGGVAMCETPRRGTRDRVGSARVSHVMSPLWASPYTLVPRNSAQSCVSDLSLQPSVSPPVNRTLGAAAPQRFVAQLWLHSCTGNVGLGSTCWDIGALLLAE